jgi:hypothetical protein
MIKQTGLTWCRSELVDGGRIVVTWRALRVEDNQVMERDIQFNELFPSPEELQILLGPNEVPVQVYKRT